MKLLLLACLVSSAWLVLLAGAAVVHRVAEDVRRIARHFEQKEAKAAKEEEVGHGHA